MGFYAPAQLVQDARRHGVEVRAADVGVGDWDCTLERNPPALRLRLRMVNGLPRAGAARITAARPFRDVQDLARRACLNRHDLEALAAADALRGALRQPPPGPLAGARHRGTAGARRCPRSPSPADMEDAQVLRVAPSHAAGGLQGRGSGAATTTRLHDFTECLRGGSRLQPLVRRPTGMDRKDREAEGTLHGGYSEANAHHTQQQARASSELPWCARLPAQRFHCCRNGG